MQFSLLFYYTFESEVSPLRLLFTEALWNSMSRMIEQVGNEIQNFYFPGGVLNFNIEGLVNPSKGD